MAHGYDVVVVGSYFCDMVFTGLADFPQLGRDIFSRNLEVVPGGSYYVVATLHRLGVKVGWLGHVGTDVFSRFVMEAVEAEGIDTGLLQRHDGPVRRVAASFSFEHERGFISYVDDLDETIALERIEQANPRCVVLHGMHYWTQMADLNQTKNRKDFAVLLDCQDTPLTLDSPGLADALRQVDIFAPNEAEACHLTGEETVEGALTRLAEMVPLVVIKCGSQGSMTQQDAKIIRVPALNIRPVDTTGAGDCFDAGFLYGYLRDEPVEQCLRYANITGGLSTTAPGALAVPQEDRVIEIARHYDQYARQPDERHQG